MYVPKQHTSPSTKWLFVPAKRMRIGYDMGSAYLHVQINGLKLYSTVIRLSLGSIVESEHLYLQ
jgi:hypothetical protein